MKNKIIALLICLSTLFSISFHASEISQEQVPKWISVKYNDLENQAVSEYQLATVTIKNYGLWFTENDYQVSVDYDPTQLELVNTVITNAYGDKTTELSPGVNLSKNNFEVSFQFYLQPDVELDAVPVTINKLKNNSDNSSETIELKANSSSMMTNYQVGSMTLGYAVDKYTNDGTNLEYNAHFKVIANPDNKDFTLALKRNTMNIASGVDYSVNLTASGGTIVNVDKTNYQLKLKAGDEFDLNIKSPVSGLSAKDKRIDFFIFVQSEDQFVRISPKFYPSDLTQAQTDTRFRRYAVIKIVIMSFFGLLSILFIIANRNRKKEPKANKKAKLEKTNQAPKPRESVAATEAKQAELDKTEDESLQIIETKYAIEEKEDETETETSK